jgi:hypothetical protein
MGWLRLSSRHTPTTQHSAQHGAPVSRASARCYQWSETYLRPKPTSPTGADPGMVGRLVPQPADLSGQPRRILLEALMVAVPIFRPPLKRLVL